MTEPVSLDIGLLRSWIGRTEIMRDEITPRLAQELNAALDYDTALPVTGAPALLAIHWCLAPPTVRASGLGADGHPARGNFLPPVPLPRRMWAGGRLQFHDPLRIGDEVERRSWIADVTVKDGRNGPLCFVAVDHEIFTARGLAITERHDIVYLPLQPPVAAKTPAPILLQPEWRREMRADQVLLFRYSALTFNGHRIHYDRPYATEVEFYPGLVVHGPLQATLLLAFAAEILSRPPTYFKFRGLNPLFDFQAFMLGARAGENGLHLWIQNEDGIQTMDAESK